MAYSALATAGKIKAIFGLVFAASIASSLCTVGGLSLRDQRSASTNGTTSGTCSSTVCTAKVSYTVSGVSYSIPATFVNVVPPSVNVYYNPSNPSDASTSPSSKITGFIFSAAGLFVLLLGILIYWLTTRFKPLAAVEGADAIYDILS